MSHILPRIIGPAAAAELMLTSRVIDAAEAARLGLTLAVLPPEDLLPRARSIADQIAEHSSFAVATVKRQMWHHSLIGLAAAVEAECDAQVLCLRTEEHAAALSRLRTRVGSAG
jgi:enoyl-CoA hydratase/carnithine racemase